jgi:hypothetical protein
MAGERIEALFEFGENILIKADSKDENIIYIEASNEKSDRQDDTVLQKALREQAKEFMRRGLISYDHLHKVLKDPRYIIGEPLDVKFPDDGRTLVKARLYPSNEYAADLKKKLKDNCTRLGSSIGGFITKRVKSVDKLRKSVNYISGIIWDEVALTFKPVNSDTLGTVQYVPYSEFAKSFCSESYQPEIFKALMAGGGTDAAAFTGGRTLIPESLQGVGKSKNLNARRMRGYLSLVVDGKVKSFKELAGIAKSEGDGEIIAPLASYLIENVDRIKKLKTEIKL